MAYPTSVWAPSTKTDNVDDILAAHINDMQTEVVALEDALLNGIDHEVLVTLGTITTDKSILDGTATWNAGGVTFTGIKVSITDNASAAASLLINLLVGAASQFKVQKNGDTTITGNLGVGAAAPVSKFAVTGASGAYSDTGIAQITTGTGINEDEKIVFGVLDGSYAWMQAVKPGTGARNLILQPNGGVLALGTTDVTNAVAGDMRLLKGLWIGDGITAPSARAGFACLFVDTADGDLKIIYGDGTTKLIVADT